MRRLALGIAGLLAIVGGVSQASAQSVTWAAGTATVKNNNISTAITKIFVTNPAVAVSPNPSLSVPANGTQFLSIASAVSPGTILSYTIQYANPSSTIGCNFTAVGVFTRSTQTYRYTFSAAPFNTTGPVATLHKCRYLNNGVTASTGAFSAQAFAEGF
jgi:hypothetical protein